MKYVRFTADPRLGNGDFEAAVYRHDTGAGVGIRRELREGDEEITEAEFAAERDAIVEYNGPPPVVEPQEPEPTLADIIAAELPKVAEWMRAHPDADEARRAINNIVAAAKQR